MDVQIIERLVIIQIQTSKPDEKCLNDLNVSSEIIIK